MDWIAIAGLLLQTVVIVGAIVSAFVKTKTRNVATDAAIKAVNVRCSHIEKNTEDLKEDHNGLSKKVDGISRHVSRIEGQLLNQKAASSR